MRTLDYGKIEYCKNNRFSFDIGRYFNQSLEVFTNNWVQFVIYSLVSAIVFFMSYFTFIGVFIIVYPLMMGFLIGAERADDGMQLELGDFFKGFKNIGTYLLFMLSIILIYVILIIPIFFISFLPLILSGQDDLNTFLVLGSSVFLMILVFVIVIILSVFQIMVSFAPYLIHYGNMGLKDSMITSYKIVKKNFWWVLLISFIVGFISSIGVVGCYVGLLATYPISNIFKYFMLKDMILTGDDTQSEIDLLGTNQE